MGKQLLGIAIVAALVGCAAPQRRPPPVIAGGIVARLVDVPTNHVIVQARVNDRLLRFIVDSGASISAVTPETAKLLALVPHGHKIVNEVPTPVARLAMLAVGNAEHRDLTVAIIDLPAADRMDVHYDGIIGLDVLMRYDVVIDFSRRVIALHPIGRVVRSAAVRDMARFDFRTSPYGLVMMDAELHFIPIPAVLDLGAQVSLVNQAACAMGGKSVQLRTPPRQVQLGSVDFGTRNLPVADLPIFRHTGMMPGPAIVLGADLFEKRTVVLAYQERAVFLSRAP